MLIFATLLLLLLERLEVALYSIYPYLLDVAERRQSKVLIKLLFRWSELKAANQVSLKCLYYPMHPDRRTAACPVAGVALDSLERSVPRYSVSRWCTGSPS